MATTSVRSMKFNHHIPGRAFLENEIRRIFADSDYPDNIITGLKGLGFERWFEGDEDEQVWAIKGYDNKNANGKFLLILNFVVNSWWLYERVSINDMDV